MAKGVAIDFDAKTGKAQSEFRKVYKELEKSKEQAKALGREVSSMGRKLERSGSRGTTSISKLDGTVGRLKASLLALAGPAMIFRTMATLAADAEQRMRTSAQSALSVEQSLRQLQQISETTEDYERYVQQARDLATTTGTPLANSLQAIFQAVSGGIADQIGELLPRAADIGIDPRVLMKSVITLKEAFGGTATEIADKLAAAAKSTKLDIGQLAGVAAIPGAQATMAGGGLDETLALVAALTGPNVSPQTAAQRVRTLAEEVNRSGYGGAGIMAGLQRFQTEKPGEFQSRIAGRSEFAEAVQLVRTQSQAITKTMGEIGESAGFIARRADQAAKSPLLVSAKERRIARVKREIEDVFGGGVGALKVETAEEERDRLYNEALRDEEGAGGRTKTLFRQYLDRTFGVVSPLLPEQQQQQLFRLQGEAAEKDTSLVEEVVKLPSHVFRQLLFAAERTAAASERIGAAQPEMVENTRGVIETMDGPGVE
jgi:methyl-accepting chemotaxis protein